MKAMSSPRFFAIYSGVLTLMFAVTVLCGFAIMLAGGFIARSLPDRIAGRPRECCS